MSKIINNQSTNGGSRGAGINSIFSTLLHLNTRYLRVFEY
jgi:hypothetical protein